MAEEKIHTLLKTRNFEGDGFLSADDFDDLFRLMKFFSPNRNLCNLLYTKNGLETFNQALKTLYYGKASLPDRVNGFFKLKGIGLQTLSQFLLAYDSTVYPLISSRTREWIELDAEQEQSAIELAKTKFGLPNMDSYLDRTKDYIRDFIIFQQVKEILQLKKYTSVNDILWNAVQNESGSEEAQPNSYTSVSLENDLRDYLAQHPTLIEPGLKLVEKEFDTQEVGRIDLLLRDRLNCEVVVELKRGKKNDEVVGQISRYLGWVMKNRTPRARGIIIVNEHSNRLEYSLIPLKDKVKVKYYRVNFEITDKCLNEPLKTE
ncbi:MAG: endonuclease NucS [Candidatus Bathyarchaeota archaeon]|nr:endonuclease NucS [Candidatus Bathyarchaeota archaeon]